MEGNLEIRGISPEIKYGIRENAEFIYEIRHMTASREAGFAEILAWDAVLGENDIRDRDGRRSGCGIAGIRTPLLDPVT